MTVADVIAELQRYSGHLPVRVLLSEVLFFPENGEPDPQTLGPDDALEATDVRFEGGHVLVVG